jgi:hypothetical protein
MNILIFGNGFVSRDLDLARRVDETDEFDKVIRMNECKLVAYHDKIGWRTDIYTFCGRPIMVDMHRNTKEIWWWLSEKRMNWLLSPENARNVRAGYDLLSREGVIHTHFHELPEETQSEHAALCKEMDNVVKAPKSITCGLALILLCKTFIPDEYKITLAGFDGAKSGHAWDERDLQSVGYHNFKGEYDWLQKQEAEDKITILRSGY